VMRAHQRISHNPFTRRIVVPSTAFESVSSQEALEKSIMFNRSISISSDITLISGIAILTDWLDRSANLVDLVFDGQVRKQ